MTIANGSFGSREFIIGTFILFILSLSICLPIQTAYLSSRRWQPRRQCVRIWLKGMQKINTFDSIKNNKIIKKYLIYLAFEVEHNSFLRNVTIRAATCVPHSSNQRTPATTKLLSVLPSACDKLLISFVSIAIFEVRKTKTKSHRFAHVYWQLNTKPLHSFTLS